MYVVIYQFMEKVKPIVVFKDHVSAIKLQNKTIMNEISESTRIKSDHLSENYQAEKNLISDLRKSNETLQKNKIEFEKELKAFNSNVDVDLVMNKSFTHMNESTLEFKKTHNRNELISCKVNFSQVLLSRGDFVGNIYLFFNTKISDIDDVIVHELLQSTVRLNIGGSIISNFNLATNILIAKLCDKEEYVEINEFTKIPLMVMHNSGGNMVNMAAIGCYTVEIIIDNIREEILDKLGKLHLTFDIYYYAGVYDFGEASKIFGNYIGGNITTDEKKTDYTKKCAAQIDFKNTYMTSKDHILNDNKLVKIPSNTKFITFRFISKDFNDIAFLKPNIVEATIITDEGMSLPFYEILSMNFLNITMFIVPLSHESLNWNSIKDSVKKCEFESTFCEFNQISVKIFTNVPYDNYDVIMSFVGFNYGICTEGRMGLVKYDYKDCCDDD